MLTNLESLKLERYPMTKNKSLRSYSAAELLMLEYIKDKTFSTIYLFNDRFGFWNCVLSNTSVNTIWTYASQKKAIERNLKLNNFTTNVTYKTPLETLDKVELALIKIPKSLELFELFLMQIHDASVENTEVVCGFMTKYFSNKILDIANIYFNIVEQSKAKKKARLLLLKKPKKLVKKRDVLNKLLFKDKLYQQYFGVFSSGHIDIGTQFLLDSLQVHEKERRVLDLASGNGIIGSTVLDVNPLVELSLVDDSNLAIYSSQINITQKNVSFHCDDNLSSFGKGVFDLVVSNPPFHFEYENNIEVALDLFRQVSFCLKPDGRFLLVANRHLNYSTHLVSLFSRVSIKAQNKKFHVIECIL